MNSADYGRIVTVYQTDFLDISLSVSSASGCSVRRGPKAQIPQVLAALPVFSKIAPVAAAALDFLVPGAISTPFPSLLVKRASSLV